MTTLRAGVIGVGHLGQHHARLYAALPDSTLVGVTDQDLVRARTIAGRHGAQTFERVQDLLKTVDVVSVAVPTSAHYAVAKACLEAGRHVLVEKPIAVLPAEAEELVYLAKTKGCTLQVGHSERFNPIVPAMWPSIQHPILIEGQRLGIYSVRGTDVDVVLDLMVHDLDLLLSCQLGPVNEIQAVGSAVLSPTHDTANARIRFERGCVANLTASRIAPMALRQWRLFQAEGSVSIDFQARRGIIGRRVTEPGRRVMAVPEEIQAGDGEPLKLQLESFLYAVRSASRPIVSGEEGAAAVELAHRVLSAMKVSG
jgi:predicted dehydrogenase